MAENNAPSRKKWPLILVSFVAGIVCVFVAAATVEATDQRAFCGQCHSMAPAALTHAESTHAQFSCNECHTPHNLLAKLPYKAKVGMHDIYMTATSQVPEKIHASAEMKNVIQENCRRCHSSTVATVDMSVKEFCTDCHRSIPHNGKLPISKREAADV